MQTKTFYPALLIIILSALPSSCAFLQKGEFAQRKYYNFPHAKGPSKIMKEEMTVLPEEADRKITASNDGQFTPLTETASRDRQSESGTLSYIPVKKTLVPAINETEKEKESAHQDNFLKQKHNRTPFPVTNVPSSNSDVMLILELILAIFIPPLAVYIHNGRVDRWFWITLLLCLAGGLFFGLTYGGYGGLFWAAAVVIAICYVLGIIRG